MEASNVSEFMDTSRKLPAHLPLTRYRKAHEQYLRLSSKFVNLSQAIEPLQRYNVPPSNLETSNVATCNGPACNLPAWNVPGSFVTACNVFACNVPAFNVTSSYLPHSNLPSSKQTRSNV